MVSQTKLTHRKINIIRKKMRDKQMNEMVWFIGIKQNGKTFYISDFDDDNHAVLWSLKKEDGISFKTDRGVQQFVQKHLNGRTDIFLVHTLAVEN